MLLAAVQTVAPAVVDLAIAEPTAVSTGSPLSRFARPHRTRRARWPAPCGACVPVRFAKFLVIVDDHVDVYDTPRVLAEIGANAVPGRDLFHYDGPPCPWRRRGIAVRRDIWHRRDGQDRQRAPQAGFARWWPPPKRSSKSAGAGRVSSRSAGLAEAVKSGDAGRLSLG